MISRFSVKMLHVVAERLSNVMAVRMSMNPNCVALQQEQQRLWRQLQKEYSIMNQELMKRANDEQLQYQKQILEQLAKSNKN